MAGSLNNSKPPQHCNGPPTVFKPLDLTSTELQMIILLDILYLYCVQYY